MMLTDGDFHVYLIPLAGDVEGCVTMGEDNYYSIYINSNLSSERQQEVLLHEMKHIVRDDFYNGLSIQDIETNIDKRNI